jgi:hypothetical protein
MVMSVSLCIAPITATSPMPDIVSRIYTVPPKIKPVVLATVIMGWPAYAVAARVVLIPPPFPVALIIVIVLSIYRLRSIILVGPLACHIISITDVRSTGAGGTSVFRSVTASDIDVPAVIVISVISYLFSF